MRFQQGKTSWMRQLLCDVIFRLWPIMPRRARVWLFMNDHLEG